MTRAEVHTDGLLLGTHIGIVASLTPEIAAIANALREAAADVHILGHRYLDWASAQSYDTVIVRMSESAPRDDEEAYTPRHDPAVLALATHQRVIALVDHPLTPAASGLSDIIEAPFEPPEVVLRTARALRKPVPTLLFRAGNLELQVENRRVIVGSEVVKLTYMEFEVLRALLAAQGRVLSSESVALRTASSDHTPTHSVAVHIYRLRSKLAGLDGAAIETVRRVGYRISQQ